MTALDIAIREIESFEFEWEIGLTGSRNRAMQALVRAPQAVALLNALKKQRERSFPSSQSRTRTRLRRQQRSTVYPSI